MVNRDELVALRREFHRHPEEGWQEFWSTSRVAGELDDLGFALHFGAEILEPAHRLGVPDEASLSAAKERARAWSGPDYYDRIGDVTGLLAERSFGDGPTVTIRCDLDALPITEAADDDHRPASEAFASENPGTMHACGHDVHLAIALGIAHALDEDAGAFDGTLRLLFQPAEEGLRGGYPLSQSPFLRDTDYFFGYHVGLGLPSGAIAAGARDFLASTKLDATFEGESAHAGQSPQAGRNALQAATTAADNLLGIPRHGDGATRINVGTIEGGTTRNAIPADATLELEVRGETTSLNAYMEAHATRMLRSAGDVHDVSVDVSPCGRAIATTSSSALVELTERGLRDSGAVPTVHRHHSVGVSEDATYLMDAVAANGGEATYLVVGSDLPSDHHTARFDVDESVLRPAVEAFAYLLRVTLPDDV